LPKILNIIDDHGNWLYAEVVRIAVELVERERPSNGATPEGSLSLVPSASHDKYADIRIRYRTGTEVGSSMEWWQTHGPIPWTEALKRMRAIRNAFMRDEPYTDPSQEPKARFERLKEAQRPPL